MIKKGVIVTSIFIFSTAIQLASQIVVAQLFGPRLQLDIFLAAVVIPAIVVTVIYGTFNDAFLPLLGRHKKNKDAFFVNHLIAITMITIAVMVLFIILSPSLARALYSSRGAIFIQAVSVQMRILFLAVPLATIATLCGSYFYVQKRFVRFPLAQAVGSLTNLMSIAVLSATIGIWALVVGFIFNIVIQILFVIPNLRMKYSFLFPNLKPFLTALVPLIIGSFALRSDVLIIRSFGAQLPEGYLLYLNLISRIFSVAAGVMTISIQIVLLPHLVEFLSQKQYAKTVSYVNRAKKVSILISLMVVGAIVVVGPLVIRLLFVGGKFSLADAEIASGMIPYFILPGLAWGVNSVFFQPLVALKKQFALGIVNVVALCLGLISAMVANTRWGAFNAIIIGITMLLFVGILGSELLWNIYKKSLIS
ncbi:hypothetical protein KC726_01955 [Candidatus Woesebacteria bacterium]|nr:hypothetical protein [Candidatus Woesebacteria bacterium]